MSTKVINFTKIRIPMLVLSLLVIIGGIVGINTQGGFNLGIDFLSGINLRLQVADEAFTVAYTGEERTVLNIQNSVLSITKYKDGGLNKEENAFVLKDYANVKSLIDAVSKVDGILVSVKGSESAPAVSLAGLNYPEDLSDEGFSVNSVNSDKADYISISDIREILKSTGSPQIQTAGSPENQEFIIRLQDTEGDKEFSVKANKMIVDALGSKYGKNNIIVKQSDYVGPRFSQSIGYQSVSLTGFALALILIYIWFRFKLAYAVSAISALVHDVLIMIGIIGTFRIEVNTATIAALLTIIGYSLNDTIVIFDRIRENTDLLKEKDFFKVVNISITQSLSRTIITSLTTLLAVVAIFLFGTGVIKIFALNLMIGVIVGTYSSIFIASPILLAWTGFVRNKRIQKAEKKYNDKKKDDDAPQLPAESSEAAPVETKESKEVKTPSDVKQAKKTASSRKERKRKSSKK